MSEPTIDSAPLEEDGAASTSSARSTSACHDALLQRAAAGWRVRPVCAADVHAYVVDYASSGEVRTVITNTYKHYYHSLTSECVLIIGVER